MQFKINANANINCQGFDSDRQLLKQDNVASDDVVPRQTIGIRWSNLEWEHIALT